MSNERKMSYQKYYIPMFNQIAQKNKITYNESSRTPFKDSLRCHTISLFFSVKFKQNMLGFAYFLMHKIKTLETHCMKYWYTTIFFSLSSNCASLLLHKFHPTYFSSILTIHIAQVCSIPNSHNLKTLYVSLI